MTAQRTAARRISQFLGDTLLGLALFALLAGLFGDAGRARAEPGMAAEATTYIASAATEHSQGFVVGLIAQSSVEPLVSAGFLTARPAPTPRHTMQARTLAVLAIVFATLVALNLGFWRHVHRTYIIGHPRVASNQ